MTLTPLQERFGCHLMRTLVLRAEARAAAGTPQEFEACGRHVSAVRHLNSLLLQVEQEAARAA